MCLLDDYFLHRETDQKIKWMTTDRSITPRLEDSSGKQVISENGYVFGTLL